MSNKSGWFKRCLGSLGDVLDGFLDWLDDYWEVFVIWGIGLIITGVIVWAAFQPGGGSTSSAAQDANRVCRQHGGVRSVTSSGDLAVCFDGTAKETGY